MTTMITKEFDPIYSQNPGNKRKRVIYQYLLHFTVDPNMISNKGLHFIILKLDRYRIIHIN